MAKYTVVVPLKDVKKTVDHRGTIVGIPFLGQSERMIMNEDELKAWFESWITDSSTGKSFYLERHAR